MLQYLAPLFQTFLWVGLIGAIVWRFHRPIHALLEALQRRVEQGSGLKAGPFELQPPIRPQSPDEQKAKLEDEVKVLVDERQIEPSNLSKSIRTLSHEYLGVEDLALRAVQAEYGVPISRQVVLGRNTRVDGVFKKYEAMYIVEVKYMPGEPKPSRIRDSLEQISKLVLDAGVHQANIVLALVLDSDAHTDGVRAILPQVIGFSAFPTEVKLYSRGRLQFQFSPGFGSDA